MIRSLCWRPASSHPRTKAIDHRLRPQTPSKCRPSAKPCVAKHFDRSPVPAQDTRWICFFEGCMRHEFKQASHLTRHQEKHFSLGRYPCLLSCCKYRGKKAFTRREHLRLHVRIHSSDIASKKFDCVFPECNYRKLSRNEMEHHIRCHRESPAWFGWIPLFHKFGLASDYHESGELDSLVNSPQVLVGSAPLRLNNKSPRQLPATGFSLCFVCREIFPQISALELANHIRDHDAAAIRGTRSHLAGAGCKWLLYWTWRTGGRSLTAEAKALLLFDRNFDFIERPRGSYHDRPLGQVGQSNLELRYANGGSELAF